MPAQTAGGAWQWEATRIPGDGSIPHRASRKLRDSEQLITRWSPALLRMELDRWLWKDVPHLGVKKLWEYLCTYGYLPRLQDLDVLLCKRNIFAASLSAGQRSPCSDVAGCSAL